MQQLIEKKRAGRLGSGDSPYKRTHRVAIWLTEEELERIRANSRSQEYGSVAQFVRQQSLAGEVSESSTCIRRGLLECHYQIHKLGVNCNQVAKHLNKNKTVDEAILLAMQDLQEQARRALTEVMKNYQGPVL